MKVIGLLFIFHFIFAYASDVDYHTKIKSLDASFSSDGPSIQLLQDYELVLSGIIKNDTNSVSSYIPKVYYKIALIEMFLGMEKKALSDFQSCIKYDPSMSLAKVQLAKLSVAHGKLDILTDLVKNDSSLLENSQIKSAVDDLQKVQETIVAADELSKKSDFVGCIEQVSDAIHLSPSNPLMYKIRINCTINAAINDQKQEFSEENISTKRSLAFSLIADYLTLEKLEPLNIDNYIYLANLYFFGLDEYTNAAKHIRKGLHYDMDNKDLKKNSHFYKRSENVLQMLDKFRQYNSWLFDKEDIEAPKISQDDFTAAIKLLFKEKPNIPARDVRNVYNGKEFANNFNFLAFLDEEFNNKLVPNSGKSKWFGKSSKHPHLINGLILDMNKVACESYLAVKDYKSSKKYCSKALEIEKFNKRKENEVDYIPDFLPAIGLEIYSLVKSENMERLMPIYEKVNENDRLKESELFKSTYNKVARLFIQKQQKQQHEQQWHQQQQQQQWQQQQQQQQQQQRQQQQHQQQQAPKNDYYKILGVAKDASDRDIKTAYRNLVKKFHPDKYKGKDAEEKITEINKAYEILGDEELRKRYDMGDDPNDQTAGSRPQGGEPFQGGFQGNPFQGNPFGGGGFPFGDGQFSFQFGGFGGQGQPGQGQGQRRGKTKSRGKKRSRKKKQ